MRVCYWLNEHGGPEVEATFLDAVADGTFTRVELTNEDVERMAELVRTFSSFPLGGTDAWVVAVAGRLGVHEIATFDRRHFPAITPRPVVTSRCSLSSFPRSLNRGHLPA